MQRQCQCGTIIMDIRNDGVKTAYKNKTEGNVAKLMLSA
jgi:hypothetical protein